jgi:hypothetical protein
MSLNTETGFLLLDFTHSFMIICTKKNLKQTKTNNRKEERKGMDYIWEEK